MTLLLDGAGDFDREAAAAAVLYHGWPAEFEQFLAEIAADKCYSSPELQSESLRALVPASRRAPRHGSPRRLRRPDATLCSALTGHILYRPPTDACLSPCSLPLLLPLVFFRPRSFSPSLSSSSTRAPTSSQIARSGLSLTVLPPSASFLVFPTPSLCLLRRQCAHV